MFVPAQRKLQISFKPQNADENTYLDVLKSTSMTKSMLAFETLARARALTMHDLSFWLFSGSFVSILTRVYSPMEPMSTMVSATVYLFSYPSLSSLTRIGMT